MSTSKPPTFADANNRPFEHNCSNGTRFRCERADLREPITVSNRPSSWKSVCEDVAEFIGYHAVNIWPDLNGFSGYDTLDFDWRRNRSSSVSEALDNDRAIDDTDGSRRNYGNDAH